MSTYSRLEARVSALERRQINTETHVEEVNEEITTEIKQLSRSIEASFRQAADYDSRTESQIDARFNQIDTHLNQVDARLDKIETALLQHTKILTQILERLPDKSS